MPGWSTAKQGGATGLRIVTSPWIVLPSAAMARTTGAGRSVAVEVLLSKVVPVVPHRLLSRLHGFLSGSSGGSRVLGGNFGLAGGFTGLGKLTLEVEQDVLLVLQALICVNPHWISL